jgi:hypothetical protein
MDHFLECVPAWIWPLCLIVALPISAWLRTCVFKVPPGEPYDDPDW